MFGCNPKDLTKNVLIFPKITPVDENCKFINSLMKLFKVKTEENDCAFESQHKQNTKNIDF